MNERGRGTSAEDEVREPGAQDLPGAAQVALELLVSGLVFPTPLVKPGDWSRSGVLGFEDVGDQGEQFVCAVAVPVGDVVPISRA